MPTSRRLVIQLCTALALKLMLSTLVYGQEHLASVANVAKLQSYEGRYQASPDTIITVRRSDSGLNMEVNSSPPLEFVPDAKDHFVHNQSGTKIRFLRNQSGEVTDLILERGGDHPAKRIGALPSPEPFRMLDVSGANFRTVISGNGATPVVFVSGIGNWAKIGDGITNLARVIRYERNEGKSAGRELLDIQTQARQLRGLLKSLGIVQPFVLVGWSFDGALARIYADVYPEDVRGLVLADPFDEGFVDWLQTNQPRNYQLFRERCTERYVSDWDGFLQSLRRSHVPQSVPVVLLTSGDRQRHESDSLEGKVGSADFEESAKAVTKAHQTWVAKIPNGRLVVVPKAGHDIPSEQPGYIITAIQQELDDITKRFKR